AIDFPIPRMTHADRNAPTIKGDLDFSFSGLKTAVLRRVRGSAGTRAPGSSSTAVAVHAPPLNDQEVADICASFQRVVVNTLLDRLFDAAERFNAQGVGIAGGVSANSRLRAD